MVQQIAAENADWITRRVEGDVEQARADFLKAREIQMEAELAVTRAFR